MAINYPLVKEIGGQVDLVAFSSTSRNENHFAHTSTDGSWLIIHCIEGKDISFFSFSPAEEEVLLLPNSHFIIKSRLTPDMKKKKVMKSNPNLNTLELRQLPTPIFEKTLQN